MTQSLVLGGYVSEDSYFKYSFMNFYVLWFIGEADSIKRLKYPLCRTVYFLNSMGEIYSTYLTFWQNNDLTLETTHLHFPKSANKITLNKRIQNALALVHWRSAHSCLLSQHFGDVSNLDRILKWHQMIAPLKFCHYFGSIVSMPWVGKLETVLRKSTSSQNSDLQLWRKSCILDNVTACQTQDL